MTLDYLPPAVRKTLYQRSKHAINRARLARLRNNGHAALTRYDGSVRVDYGDIRCADFFNCDAGQRNPTPVLQARRTDTTHPVEDVNVIGREVRRKRHLIELYNRRVHVFDERAYVRSRLLRTWLLWRISSLATGYDKESARHERG